MQARNTAQPSKACRKPSAGATPRRSTMSPMAAMRSAFIAIASGTAAASSASFSQSGPR